MTLADDRVKRARELRKVKGKLRAALKRGDLMEAEQVRRVMTDHFGVNGLDDDSVSDPDRPCPYPLRIRQVCFAALAKPSIRSR